MADRREELIKSLATDGVDVSEFTAVDALSPAGKEIRKQELLKSLGGDDPNIAPQPAIEPVPEATPFTLAERDEGVLGFMDAPEFAISDPSDVDFNYLRLRDDAQARFGTADAIGFTETMKNTRVQEKLPFVGSLYKFNRIANVFEAAKNLTLDPDQKVWDVTTPEMHFLPSTKMIPRVQASDRRAHDVKIVEEWLIELEEKQARGVSVGGRIAEGITELPAFMVEFLLTGPIFKTGSTAAKTAATKLLGRFAEKGTSKLAIRVAGAGFGTALRTAVNMPRVLAGAAENMTSNIQITDDGAIAFSDDVSPFKALSSSFTDLYIENLTEVAGKAIGEGAGKAVEFVGGKLAKRFPMLTKFTNELGQKWIANGASKGVVRTSADFLKATATKVGYDGILEEMAEEQLGRMLRVATGKEDLNTIVPSMEDLLVEAGIFLVPGAASLATTKIFRSDPLNDGPVRDTDVLRQDIGEELNLSERLDNVPLFQSEKNKALAEADMAEALEFIEDRIGGKDTFGDIPPVVSTGDDVPDFAGDIAADQAMRVVNASTKAKAIDGNFKEATVTEPAGPLKRAIVRNLARAEDAVGTWGKTGKKVQKDLREISFRTAVNTGNSVQNIKPWTKNLSKKEKVIVAQLIDGAIARDNQPDRLIVRADAIRKELDVIQDEALSIGLRTNALSGKAFPQVLNKAGVKEIESWEFEGPKSAAVFAKAQGYVQEGQFRTVADAIVAMQQYREGLIAGKNGYVEGTRTLEIGNEFRDWNLDKVLSNTIESAWEKIEAGRQWGVIKTSKTDGGQMMLPFKDIQVDMAKLRADVGSNEANALNEYLKAQYGLSGADTALVKVARVARTTQFVGKLAFSPLTISRNILDRYAKGLSHGTLLTNARAGVKYPPFLNHWMKSARLIEDQMIRSGAVLGHGHLSEGFASGEGVISLIAKPFASSEKGNQTYIALVKKIQLESDVKRLMELEGREGAVSKAFDTMATFVGQSQKQTRNRVLTNLSHEQLADAMGQAGQINPEVMQEVLHRTVTDSAFPLTLASKRLWWGNKPVMQAATQFKVWSADQTRFIYKDVIKYGTQTGDWSRLARFMVGTWLMGELYNISRDFMLNKDESLLSKAKGGTLAEIMMAIGKDLVDGGIVGFLADFVYGIGDWAAGPTVSSISGFTKAIDQAQGTASLPEALGRFALQDIPALRQAQGVMDRVDREFFDTENNLTKNYARWQGRSFDFRLKDGESSAKILKDRIMRSVRGVPTQKIGERSLSLNMIARQVLVGDFNDATEHIKRIIRQTEPKDIKSTIQSLKQSKRNNSPFGNISKERLGRFIAQFDPKEAKEGFELQKQWNKGYQKSIDDAVSQLVDEGFEREFGDKAKKYKDAMDIEAKETAKKLKEIEAEFEK